MKKSKSSSKRRRERSSPDEPSRSRRSRARSRSSESDKRARHESKSAPRKTRWHEEPEKKDAKAIEKQSPASEPPRIEELLADKTKTVDHLFSVLPESMIQELIPGNLKKYSKEELKKLCFEEIKEMSKDLLLHIISGKDPKSFKDVEIKSSVEQQPRATEKQGLTEKVTKAEASEEKETAKTSPTAQILEENDSSSRDVLELFAASNEMEGIIDEENKAPAETENSPSDEGGPGLESDAELLELEMRARAIRSLLRAKGLASASEVEKMD